MDKIGRMGQSGESFKKLLKDAEGKIVELQTENAQMAQSFSEMLDAQQIEAQQMVELSEQVWALEGALSAASQDKEEILKKLNALNKTMSVLQKHMADTLEAAAKNASKMEIAARVYEMAVTSEAAELDKVVKNYNANLQGWKVITPARKRG